MLVHPYSASLINELAGSKNRQVCCSCFAITFAARKKFDVASTNLRFVFETDGTEVDDLDLEALQAVAAEKHILIVLVGDEQWTQADSVVSRNYARFVT